MLRAKKSLGQHFLNSKHALEQIILAADIKKHETVLEIGPGTGILTTEILKTNAKMIAVEKDDRAILLLLKRFAREIVTGKMNLIHGDILDEKLALAGELPMNFVLVANIPYYITGAILEKFLEKGPRPNRMVLLVQKEVADRILAKDGKESILSIAVKCFGEPKIVEKVPKGAFLPPPKVDSAILRISNISDENLTKNGLVAPQFFKVLKAGFAHKRKLLMKNLESVSSKEAVEKTWKNLDIDPKIRAEKVNFELWIQIAKQLS